MKVVISAGGRFHALRLAQQLNNRGYLSKLFTFSYTRADSDAIPPAHVHNVALCAGMDFFYSKLRLGKFINKSWFNVCKDNLFDHSVKRQVRDLGSIDIFVGWAHYVRQTLSVVRKTGALVVLESGSCHILEQHELIAQEYKKYEVPVAPINQRTVAKMLDEYEQADYIMTLSEFAYQSFIKRGIAQRKLLKVSCGIDVEYFLYHNKPNGLRLRQRPRPFRVLFVGLLCLRKGVQYLLEAWNQLNMPESEVELLLVGCLQKDLVPLLKSIALKKNVKFIGSVSRSRLKELYQDASLVVLPSVEDGFGMVLGEAMASGLPVICTTNTAGADLIESEKHGFIVPACSAQALAEKIMWFFKHPDQGVIMGTCGQEHVQRFSWEQYGRAVVQVYEDILKRHRGKHTRGY